MCRGLALGLDKKALKIVCKGVSSHSDTYDKPHDEYVSMEIMRDDNQIKGYRLELDKQYMTNGVVDDTVYKMHKRWITKVGMSAKLVKLVNQWEQDNQTNIYRWLLKCSTYANIDGAQSNNSATIGEDQSNDIAKIDGNQSNYNAEIDGYQSNYHATIHGYQKNDYTKIDGYQSNYNAKIGEDIYLNKCQLLLNSNDHDKRDKVNNWIAQHDNLTVSNMILNYILK